MRILFLAEALSPHIARWERAFVELGWEVVVASCDFNDSFSGIRLESRYVAGPVRYLSLVEPIKRLISEFQPQLVNAHFLPTYGLAAALANAHPLVITLWGSDVLVSGSRGWLRKLRSRFVLKRADLVVADAECLLAAATAITPLRRQLLVSFGVKRSWFESGLARELSPREKLRIFSCRRFEPLYDVQTIVRAAAILRDQGILFELRLAGSGSLESELRALVGKLSLTQEVVFLGSLKDEQLFNEYRAADFYVSTALSDSTSVSLLEAMSQRAYPVVTDIPGNREWLTDDRHFFKPGDHGDLTRRIAAALDVELRRQAAAEYEVVLRHKGIREEQMRVAHLTFLKLIDEYPRTQSLHHR